MNDILCSYSELRLFVDGNEDIIICFSLIKGGQIAFYICINIRSMDEKVKVTPVYFHYVFPNKTKIVYEHVLLLIKTHILNFTINSFT